MKKICFAVTCLCLLNNLSSVGRLLAAGPGEVPSDSGVKNVKDYGAKGDGVTDDTAAIQEAFNKNSGSGAVIFLPKGTYLVSKHINWAGAKNRNVMQGESESESIVKLMNNAPGFQDPDKPQPMFHTGGAPAQRFQNAVRTLTIDVGKGNPGAVALNFYANNTGAIRHVTLRSGVDGKSAGLSGLDLTESEVGPLLVFDLTVIGFEYGIRVGRTVNSVTLEKIQLRDQRVAGILNRDNLVFARRVRSLNQVPAVINQGHNGVVTLIDSQLLGGAADQVAIENQDDNAVLFVRNVETGGYGTAIADTQLEKVPGGKVVEWCSNAPIGLFPGELSSLNLPIKETPEVPWDPVESWVDVATFGALPGDGKGDTIALQKAIDSGATTLFLRAGRELPQAQRPNNPGWEGSYVISDTIHIRGKVRRIIGLDATFHVGRNWPEGHPAFVFEDGEAPVVVIQQMAFGLGVKLSAPAFVHQASRDLVLRSFTGTDQLRHVGKGHLFVDDTVGNHWYIGPGSKAYVRQLNLEGDGMKLVNDGGLLWVLGLKTEAKGPILETRNGGYTEIVGAHLYTCVNGSQNKGAFYVEDATFGLVGGGEYVWTRDWATDEILKETRQGETRVLSKDALPRRHFGSMFAMIGSHTSRNTPGAVPAIPVVKTAESTSGSVSFRFENVAPEVVGIEVLQEGQPVAYVNTPT